MSSDDALIGRRLIELRAGRGQVEVEGAMRDAGWSWGQATVWNLEPGERALKLAEARDLAATLGCSIEDLLPELTHEQLTRRRWLEAEIERAPDRPGRRGPSGGADRATRGDSGGAPAALALRSVRAPVGRTGLEPVTDGL
jgi:hypothetical protein